MLFACVRGDGCVAKRAACILWFLVFLLFSSKERGSLLGRPHPAPPPAELGDSCRRKPSLDSRLDRHLRGSGDLSGGGQQRSLPSVAPGNGNGSPAGKSDQSRWTNQVNSGQGRHHKSGWWSTCCPRHEKVNHNLVWFWSLISPQLQRLLLMYANHKSVLIDNVTNINRRPTVHGISS